jgi:hypothetical protein
MKTPATGRIVLYVLSQHDCEVINQQRRRCMAAGLVGEHESPGNPIVPGDIVPAIIVRVWNEQNGLMNGQALLDGPDSLWLLSRHSDDTKAPGTWHWPEVQQPAAQPLKQPHGLRDFYVDKLAERRQLGAELAAALPVLPHHDHQAALGIIHEAQSILARHLPPDGITSDAAINELLALLDHPVANALTLHLRS